MPRYGMTMQQAQVTLLSQRLGANIITSNSTFDTNLTGWNTVGSPIETTPNVVSGRAHVKGDAGTEGIGRGVTLVTGRRYRLSFNYEVISGALTVFKTGMPSIVGLTGSAYVINPYVVYFVETDGTARNMNFVTEAVAGEWYLDNVTLQQVT
jgi:hypothetical protein